MTRTNPAPPSGSALRRAHARIARLGRESPDPMTLFARVADIVPTVVGADGVCGLTLDPATLLHTGGFHHGGVPHTHLPRLLQIEYGEEDVNQFPALVKAGGTAAGLWQATRHRPHCSSRYRDVYRPAGMGDEMRVLLRTGHTVWGALVLHRGGDRAPFGDDEVAALAALAPAVAQVLRGAYLRHDAAAADCELPTAPGLLMFHPGGELDRVTPAGHQWLEQLVAAPAESAPLPQPVLHALSRARTAGDASLRMRSRTGLWVSLTATRTDADGGVAVMIQPSSPEHVIGILMDAYGLTLREQQVAQLVTYGMSDTDIGRRLGISPHTVRDHLKKVFDKTATNSRGRLLQLLYFSHYQPDIETGRTMGRHGWFRTAQV
ncbi:helix-turn-helix transcriptional regulator [Streptomyces sp. A0592]|uniref:helix-turn-helix transcriptional regulator n=1 Tax=Streptomyces sp. A0592 TaxID=2563099 RepID=UPI001444E524|nr:helix-turn-helix transcriptional regulator [Streptomyces sp. A0592]